MHWIDNEGNSIARTFIPGYANLSFVVFVRKLEQDLFEWSVSLEKREARAGKVHAWVFIDSSRNDPRVVIKSLSVAKTLGEKALTRFLDLAVVAHATPKRMVRNEPNKRTARV